MSEWTWEYLPDAEHVVVGLDPRVRAQVERLAARLADACAVRYLGDPAPEESGVSPLLHHAEGRLIVWYQEHRRLMTAFIKILRGYSGLQAGEESDFPRSGSGIADPPPRRTGAQRLHGI